MSAQQKTQSSFDLIDEFHKTTTGISWHVIIVQILVLAGFVAAFVLSVMGGFRVLQIEHYILLGVCAGVFFGSIRYILGNHFADNFERETHLDYGRIWLGIVLYFASKTGIFIILAMHVPAFPISMWAVAYLFYVFTGLGVTIGYHRLITHRAFRAGRVFGGLILGGGSMALEGAIDTWARNHRIHHARTEIEEQDPHTPREGFWWSHFLWLWFPYIYTRALRDRYGAGLDNSNPLIVDQKRLQIVFILAGFLVPALAFGAWGLISDGLVEGLVWGGKSLLLIGLTRLFVVYNITFSVNSWAHTWGPHPYKNKVTGDSRDVVPMAVLSFGETLQNIHHLMQDKALYWVRPHYVDMSGALIVGLSRLHDVRGFRWIGLPYDLKLIGPGSKRFMEAHTIA